MKLTMTGQEKGDFFYTGGHLIEVTDRTGLTVLIVFVCTIFHDIDDIIKFAVFIFVMFWNKP